MKAQYVNEHTDQHCLEFWDRTESLHKAGLPEERAPVEAEHYANGSFPPNCCVHGRDLNVRSTSIRDIQSVATNVRNG